MSVTFAAALLFAITIALVLLPLLPTFSEWRNRRDTAPLRVVYESEVDIESFAKSFRSFIDSNFRSILEECRQAEDAREGTLGENREYIAVGSDGLSVLSEVERRVGRSRRLVLSSADLLLPDRTVFLGEIYAGRSVYGGERSIYRAILAEDSIDLGSSSRSLRWLHAGKRVHAAAGSVLHGRVSAGEVVNLEDGCGFERLRAPRIEFGATSARGGPEAGKEAVPSVVLQPEDVPHLVEVEAGRWLVARKLEVPPDVIVEADIVVTGWCRVGRGARIVGSIKSHKDLHLAEGVQIEGSAVSGYGLYVGAGCHISGPALAETDIHLARGSTVGTAQRLTTVSGRTVHSACGVVVHGTVWAHVVGQVLPDSTEAHPGIEA